MLKWWPSESSAKNWAMGRSRARAILDKRVERGNGVAVFDARKVAAQQAGLLFDVALGQAFLQTIGANGGADLHGCQSCPWRPRLLQW